MDKDQETTNMFTRRSLFIGALQAGCLVLLGSRLAWLEIVHGKKYKMLSDKNRINLKILMPTRGIIVDRYDKPLARNEQNFRVLVTPEETDNLEATLLKLAEIIELSPKQIQRTLKQAKHKAAFVPLNIKDKLNWEEVAKIEVNLPDLPGLSIDVGEIRSYPYNEATAHLVGYVGAVNKSELTGDPVLTLPGFHTGKTGLEKKYDKTLRGTAGTAEVEVNVSGRQVRELKRNKGKTGQKVILTLDAELQAYTQKRLSTEKSASAVIMDVHTGAIYTLSSSPSFNPNDFTKGLSAETWEELLANPGHPLNNKASGGQYPPGSTFKMITALAGLEEGIINSRTKIHCPGHYNFGKDRFHCWNRSGHGNVDVIASLAESCDIYFYDMATKLGIDKLAVYAERLGLGKKYGFEVPGERGGLVPTKRWKMGYFGSSWHPGETIVASIGQGYMQATPLQLTVMTSRLVNGGYAVEPWITSSIGDQLPLSPKWPKLGFQRHSLSILHKGMNRVVNHSSGTAHASRIETPGMSMGGKTGTSQVKRINEKLREEGISNQDLPWRYRHHALFVGYAPANNPRYACCVVVEHGGSGSATAAPIARDLLYMAQKRDPASSPVFNANNLMSVEGRDNLAPRPLPKPEQS